jgi:hypothetical protein
MQIRLVLFFSTFVTLALVHYVSIEFFLYWKYFWMDMFTHMLGGVVIVLGISILPFIRIRFFEPLPPLFTSLFAVVCIGIAWELFEILAGLSLEEPGFVFDTSLDMVMDLAGGMVGYGIIESIKKL